MVAASKLFSKSIIYAALLANALLSRNVDAFLEPVTAIAATKFALSLSSGLAKDAISRLMEEFACTREKAGEDLLKMIENYFGRPASDQTSLGFLPKFPRLKYSKNYWVKENFESMHYEPESSIMSTLLKKVSEIARMKEQKFTELTIRDSTVDYMNNVLYYNLLRGGVRPEMMPGRDALACILPTQVIFNIDAFLKILLTRARSGKRQSCTLAFDEGGEYSLVNVQRIENTVRMFARERVDEELTLLRTFHMRFTQYIKEDADNCKLLTPMAVSSDGIQSISAITLYALSVPLYSPMRSARFNAAYETSGFAARSSNLLKLSAAFRTLMFDMVYRMLQTWKLSEGDETEVLWPGISNSKELITAELKQPSGLLDFAYYEQMYQDLDVNWVDFTEKYILNPGNFMSSPYKCSRFSCGSSVKKEQQEKIEKYYPPRTCAELMEIYKEGIAKNYKDFKVGMRGSVSCHNRDAQVAKPGRYTKMRHLVETFCKESLLPGNSVGEFELDDDDDWDEDEDGGALEEHMDRLYEEGISQVQNALDISDDTVDILSSSFEMFGLFREIRAWRRGNPGQAENTNFEILKVNYIKYGPFYDTACSKTPGSTEFEERGSMSYCQVTLDMANPVMCPQLCNKPGFNPCGEGYFAYTAKYGEYDKFEDRPEAATVRHMLMRRNDAIVLLCGYDTAQEDKWDKTGDHYAAKQYYRHFIEYFMPTIENLRHAYRSEAEVAGGSTTWREIFDETREAFLKNSWDPVKDQNPGGDVYHPLLSRQNCAESRLKDEIAQDAAFEDEMIPVLKEQTCLDTGAQRREADEITDAVRKSIERAIRGNLVRRTYGEHGSSAKERGGTAEPGGVAEPGERPEPAPRARPPKPKLKPTPRPRPGPDGKVAAPARPKSSNQRSATCAVM